MAAIDTQPMSQQDEGDLESQPFSEPIVNAKPLWGVLLYMEKPNLPPVKLELTKEVYKIGRGEAADCMLNAGNCSIIVSQLSRIHFSIKRQLDMVAGWQVIIEDGSGNGTFLNGRRVCKGRSMALTHGDVIALTCKKKKIFTFIDPNFKSPIFPLPITQKFIICQLLGKGSFGEVYLAIQKGTFKKYAIKSVKCLGKSSSSRDNGLEAMDMLRNEADLLCGLEHPCIVKVENIFCHSKSIHLVLELMSGGDLQDKLDRLLRQRSRMKEATAKYYFFQLLKGVEYCHDNGIVHRDLKPENILMSSQDDDAILKITDFGLSKLVDENTALKTYCGTPSYLAPEVIKARHQKIQYTAQCDIWSLGVILFILLSGYHPFNNSSLGDRHLEDVIKKAEFTWRKKVWDKVSPHGRSLVRLMLQVDPTKRPTVTEIYKHPWMMDDHLTHQIDAKSGLGRLRRHQDSVSTTHRHSDEDYSSLDEQPQPKRLKRVIK